MPKIKITRATIIDGVPAAVGETVEVSDKDARYVCAIGKAVPVETSAQQRKGGKSGKTESHEE